MASSKPKGNPLIINSQIYREIKRFSLTLLPSYRNVILAFEKMQTDTLTKNLTPLGDDETYPQKCLIFEVIFVTINKQQFLGNVFFFNSTSSYKVADTIKAYIDDLSSCDLRVMATVSSGKMDIINIINELKLVNNLNGELYYVVGKRWKVYHIFDPSWLLRTLFIKFQQHDIIYIEDKEEKIASFDEINKVMDKCFPFFQRTLENTTTAARLFSYTVSTILMKQGMPSKKLKGTATFCLFFDKLFDSFNATPDQSRNENKIFCRPCSKLSIHRMFWMKAVIILKTMHPDYKVITISKNREEVFNNLIHKENLERKFNLSKSKKELKMDKKGKAIDQNYKESNKFIHSDDANKENASNLNVLLKQMNKLVPSEIHSESLQLECENNYFSKSSPVSENKEPTAVTNALKSKKKKENKPKQMTTDDIQLVKINCGKNVSEETLLQTDNCKFLHEQGDVYIITKLGYMLAEIIKLVRSLIHEITSTLQTLFDFLIKLININENLRKRIPITQKTKEMLLTNKVVTTALLPIVMELEVCTKTNGGLKDKVAHAIIKSLKVVESSYESYESKIKNLPIIEPEKVAEIQCHEVKDNELTPINAETNYINPNVFEMWIASVKGIHALADKLHEQHICLFFTKMVNCDSIHNKLYNLRIRNKVSALQIVLDTTIEPLDFDLNDLAFTVDGSYTVR